MLLTRCLPHTPSRVRWIDVLQARSRSSSFGAAGGAGLGGDTPSPATDRRAFGLDRDVFLPSLLPSSSSSPPPSQRQEHQPVNVEVTFPSRSTPQSLQRRTAADARPAADGGSSRRSSDRVGAAAASTADIASDLLGVASASLEWRDIASASLSSMRDVSQSATDLSDASREPRVTGAWYAEDSNTYAVSTARIFSLHTH